MKAAHLFEQGFTQAEVARRCKVSRQTAMRWFRAWDRGGREGLEPSNGGYPSRLTDAQRKRLRTALRKGAKSHGWPTNEWTSVRVQELIATLFRVSYHRGHAWRLMRDLRYS